MKEEVDYESPRESGEIDPLKSEESLHDDFEDDGSIFDVLSRHNEINENEDDVSSEMKPASTYPADCYSFMSIHGPFENPIFFGFGFMVWAFQIAFLILLVLRVASPRLSTNEDTDNPENGFLGQFIPSNVNNLSRATQFMALLSYCIFADESLKDIVTAVETCPRLKKAKEGDKVRLAFFSCFLRFTQGMLATISVLLLVVTTPDVIEIILNFTAVNFISAFDDVAFELAQWGKYGPKLEAEAKRIEDLPMPNCMCQKNQHVRYNLTVLPVATVLILLFTVMAVRQDSRKHWLTQRMRVQFEDDSSLEPYSGCYDMDDSEKSGRKRVAYRGFEENPSDAKFGYCEVKRKWYMWSGNETKACEISRDQELAHSGITYAFDISSSFEASWYSSSGTPLELYFFEEEEYLDDEMCSSFLGDGICNQAFNGAENNFDGGDCCAATCKYPNCGLGSLSRAFNTDNVLGDGFSECIDPTMKPITILIDDVYVASENSAFGSENALLRFVIGREDVPPRNPTMIIDCNGRNVLRTTISPDMINQTETIMVADGAECKMMVRNSTITGVDVLYVNYTVFHGNAESIYTNPIAMKQGSSFVEEAVAFKRIPNCFFSELDGIIDTASIYTDKKPSNKAVEWLMNDPSGFSTCDNTFFVERYALAAINFAAPIAFGESASFNESLAVEEEDSLWITPDRHCVWTSVGCIDGSVVELNFDDRGFRVSGKIATEIGLLSNLRFIGINNHDLRGSVPSEMGLLANLTVIGLSRNRLKGTIPTEFGQLSKLQLLDLSSNRPIPKTGISGTIPVEITNLSSLEVLLLYVNSMTGQIPDSINEMLSLSSIALGANALSGTIPPKFGEMNNLDYIGLDNNFLTGTIPTELGESMAATIILDNNLLTGSVPSDLLENTLVLDLGIYGNALSDLVRIDGSEICTVPVSDDVPYYGTTGGEHYCHCRDDCITRRDRPDVCACESAQACCEEYKSQYKECVVCEFGSATPNLYIEEFGATCTDALEYVRTNLAQFGTEEQCNEAKAAGKDFGCVCLESAQEVRPCKLCEFGISNPDFFLESYQATCSDAATYIFNTPDEFGTEELCGGAKYTMKQFGCVCNDSVEETLVEDGASD